MRRLFLLAAGAVLAPAHDPVTTKITWSAEISRIVYNRCVGCHREGGSAPMSLVKFSDASPWAKAIRDEVISRRMPQWGAVKGFGEFRDDLSLTEDEITRIADWVEGGAPEGDPVYLPSKVPPSYTRPPAPAGVRTRATRLRTATAVIGIRPLSNVSAARITAVEPDGTVHPLIWLMNYQAKWNRTFLYREPVVLPAGTRIASEPATAVELLVARAKSPTRAR